MPTLKHCYGLNHLHYVTTSTYRLAGGAYMAQFAMCDKEGVPIKLDPSLGQ